MSHRSIYTLAGLQAAAEELSSHNRDKLKPSSAMSKAAALISQGVGVLRQMVAQVSAADLEFANDHSWVLAAESDKSNPLESMGALEPGVTDGK